MFNVVANCVHLYICREKTFMAIRNRIKKRQNEKNRHYSKIEKGTFVSRKMFINIHLSIMKKTGPRILGACRFYFKNLLKERCK